MALLAVAMTGCGGKNRAGNEAADSVKTAARLEGDSCVYGLACDGCTDSVLVLLPENLGDPVSYEIIDVRHAGRVFGKPRIGDQMALLIDPEDSLTASLVIDLEQLKGTWCYTVLPQMRAIENMSKRLRRRMERDMPDSVRRSLLKPREYGFVLSSNNVARPVGGMARDGQRDGDSPVVYPEVPMYSEWHTWNGRIILMRHDMRTASAGKGGMATVSDTADIALLTADSLSLRFTDGTLHGYYKKEK